MTLQRVQAEELNRWNVGSGLYRWNRGMRVPIHWIGPDDGCGDEFTRKRFRAVIMHGDGTAYAVVFVDGRKVSQGTIQATQTPDRPRRLNLPRGTTGYSIRVELWGHFRMDLLNTEFDPLPGVP